MKYREKNFASLVDMNIQDTKPVALCLFAALLVVASGTSRAALSARDLDSNPATIEAYYDTTLHITWLADANYANSSGYATVGASGGPNNSGVMTWDNAMLWAAGLNINGITSWRLPAVTDTGPSGCDWDTNGTDCGYNVDVATGEMADMFHTTLGNLAFYTTTGTPRPVSGLNNHGPFSNLQATVYWSGLAADSGSAWYFNFGLGHQEIRNKTYDGYAWAVHAGDVGAAVVPAPAAAWLLASALFGLAGMRRGHRRWHRGNSPATAR